MNVTQTSVFHKNFYYKKKWRHRDESLLYNEMRNQLVGLSVVVTKNNLFCEDEHLIGFLSNEKVREVKFMAKRVFFSFYYENDLSRALVVKNNWALKENEESGFISNSEFERMKRDGDEAIERWIDKQIAGTSVTVVLIGSETLDSKYVQYAIKKSVEVDVILDNELLPFLYPNILVNYKPGDAITTLAIDEVKDEDNDLKRIKKVYEFVANYIN